MNAYKEDIAPIFLHPRLLVAAQSLPLRRKRLPVSPAGLLEPAKRAAMATWKESLARHELSTTGRRKTRGGRQRVPLASRLDYYRDEKLTCRAAPTQAVPHDLD